MNNQTRVIIISLSGLIVSIGLFLFIIKPTLNKIDESKKEVISKKTELKQLEEQITIFKNSQKDLAQASGKDTIAGSLLIREDLQFAIEQIEAAATTLGIPESLVIVDDENKKSSPVAKPVVNGKSFLTEVPYTLSVSSDFAKFINFMQYLEHLPHFTEISKISMTTASGTSTGSGAFVHSSDIIGTIDSVFFIQKK